MDKAELFAQTIWKELSSEEKKSMMKFFTNAKQKTKKVNVTNVTPLVQPDSAVAITEEQQNLVDLV
jgi:uncharacterized protein YdeI (YjbR/CyaY-like superfamily)